MPTEREREYYRMGFIDGLRVGRGGSVQFGIEEEFATQAHVGQGFKPRKPKRKLSAWNKYVKANSNKPRFRYKSGAKKGKLNLKNMAVAFRKTPAGKKKRR